LQSDEELIAEIRRGIRSAMEVLIRRYYKLVFGIVYRKTGDYHMACDLTQEVFIKVAKSVSSYTGEGKFKSWLTTITYHHCADHFRSASHTRKKNEIGIQPEIVDESMNVYRLLERNDERKAIRNALMDLPDYQRDTIVFSYFEGMKIREIAELMQCTESTVKSRLFQGLTKLRKMVKGGDGYDEERHNS
jgi:RNA polymerase sigma factor (sigma-70 family)